MAIAASIAKAIRRLVEAGFPESTAEKIVMGDLPMDAATKAARMQEQGYTIPQFHGTYASDFIEVDPSMVDLGLHSGSFEQAVQRLRNTADPFGGKSYGDFGYREGANVMPLMIKAENPLEMRDVGDWMNSVQVLEGMIGNPRLANRRGELESLYEEATELQSQFEGGDFLEESFRSSQENRELLDDLKDMLREEGYDSVRYKNQVENAYGSQSALRPTAEQERRELSDQISRLENTAMERAPQPPDPDDPLAAEKMREFLDAARQPSAYMTEGELARIESLKDRYREIGADPESYNDPFSYISLKGENVRSVNAAFDPDQADSPNILAGLAPYAIPTVLGGSILGAAMIPEKVEAAGFGTLARAIGRPTRAAYTGSAAKYARPSLQSVGTGEGNQAFGYGLYFSDSPEIAGGYRRGVAGQKVLDRMSDRYLLDDLDLQSVDEMLDLGEFDLEDEKLIRALQDADYLGFDRPMDAVRAAFGPDLNAFDASDPAVQKLKGIADEVGFLYEVEVPAEDFIDWNLTLDEQPKVVQQVVRQNAQDPRIRDKIDAGSFRGSDAYYLFGNNPEVNSMMWAQYGVPGVRYNSFGRSIRGLDDARARKDAPQNYVIFDENLINIVRRNDEALEGNFDETSARAAALDVRKPLAAILAAGAAGTTQAAEMAPGEYDARASARLGAELDRLMQLAEIRRQPSIEPLQDTAMARVGDYLLEDRPSEMDTLQRALQRLDMGQGIGDWLQTTGQGDPTTIMQDLMAGLDIFDVATLLPGAGVAATKAVRKAAQ